MLKVKYTAQTPIKIPNLSGICQGSVHALYGCTIFISWDRSGTLMKFNLIFVLLRGTHPFLQFLHHLT